MTISLATEDRQQLTASIKRYFVDKMEEEIGDLKADLLLDFCLQEICPTIYNEAIKDAQSYFLTKVDDLEGSCYEPEFGYWETRQ